MARLLLADDDRVIREGMKGVLTAEGYEVVVARDGEDAILKFAEKSPDLVLLDIDMPRKSGFAVCGELRKRDVLVPILFLTANDQEANEVRACDAGADGFLSKSETLGVQLAHIRRALERTRVAGQAVAAQQDVCHLGRVTVDLSRRTVSDGTRTVCLTGAEAVVFACLYRKRGETVPYADMLTALREARYLGDINSVRVHVRHLREKLGVAGDCVATVTNCGYYLVK